jgi:hypothetical protein
MGSCQKVASVIADSVLEMPVMPGIPRGEPGGEWVPRIWFGVLVGLACQLVQGSDGFRHTTLFG